MNRAEAQELLRKSLANPAAQFRDGQWEAIDALVNKKKKLLVVQRTGWGKSSVYFISTRIVRDQGAGATVIVSPLLALMRNQIEAAERLGIRAVTINSTNSDQWEELEQQVLSGQADAILISPERLANETFVERVLMPIASSIGLMVVDEAHCISDWGHDFRPDYRRLVSILKQIPPNVPVLGTTATANDRVIDDIQNQLGDIEIQRGTLERESLALQTIRLPDQAARLAWLAGHVPELSGTGIIYTLTIRDAEQVANWLVENGINAKPYYGSVNHDDFPSSDAYRQHLESQLLNNELKVLVATTALGMGYDKPDLGFVVHYQAPGSIVAYYQQVGRAGRAIDHAFGVLLSGREDEDIHEFFRDRAFPDEDNLLRILRVLEESDGLTLNQLQTQLNLTYGQIEQVLKYLNVESPAPVVKVGSQWRRTPVLFQMDHEKIARLTGQREAEWLEVLQYVEASECLMGYLRRILNDPQSEPCGKCANCLGEPVVSPVINHNMAVKAAYYLKHAEIPLVTKKQVAPGAFIQYGFRGNLPLELRAETGRILSRWGDAGWGAIVANDKHHNHFRDKLVAAVVEMINERWQPDPAIEWVTCVPSMNHPQLVPDFARRVANALGLPFIDAIKKVNANQQQKFQRNRFFQCRNLDGVFEINDQVLNSPVLLIDDIVDSAWTMTVLAALLRQHGCSAVFPVALATSSGG